jgi:hypothetical protein
MIELITVESIIGMFLLLHIARPYMSAFREADGFVFFPGLALFFSVAMILAYGIRPECLPLFLFILVYSILTFPSVVAIFSRLKNYNVHDGRLSASFLAVLLLLFSIVIAFRFSPRDEWDDTATQKTQFTVNDPARNVDLFVSYYQGGKSDLVLMSPPVTMPLSMVEDICFAFQEKGYKMLAFSRPYFDCTAIDENGEAVELSVFHKIKRYQQAMSSIKNINMTRYQRHDTAEREADIRFLLSALKADPLLREMVPNYENIFLAGYGAGGAASVGLSGNKAFLRDNPAVKAAAAIESIALCDFSEREYESGKNAMENIGIMFGRFFNKPLPRLENITHPEIPVLFVTGDGAQGKNRYNRYMAVIQTMLESGAPFLFASVNGIHAIDFSAFSRKYPILSLFLKGKKEGPGVWPREDAIANMADYLAAFFSLTKNNVTVTYLADNLASSDAVFLETSRAQ